MESSYFLFGLSDWSISLFPDNSVAEADGSVEVQLQRHTSFDHLCYVRYRIILGDEGTFDSGDLEQVTVDNKFTNGPILCLGIHYISTIKYLVIL